MSCWTKFATVCFATATLLAQTSRGTATPEGASPNEARADLYSESKSRELFTSCDGNSDDRLDFFEACEAFDWLRGRKDHAGFARLDQDRDGYVGWSEFDRHFKTTVQRGTIFRVNPCRRLVEQAPEQQKARTATPVQRFVQLLDANRNGGIDPAEVEVLTRLGIVSPAILNQLRTLDADRSGRIEDTELAPWFEQHRLVAMFGSALAGAETPRIVGDDNGDGAIDEPELTRMLQRLDPSLGRWASVLMRRLDHNQDRRLDQQELAPAAGTTPATSTAPVLLPKEAPVR